MAKNYKQTNVENNNDNRKEPPYSEAIIFQEEKKKVVVYLNDKVAITFTVLLRKFDKRVPKEHILYRYDYAFNDADGSIVITTYHYTLESPAYGIKQILYSDDFAYFHEGLGSCLIDWLPVESDCYRPDPEDEILLNIPGRLYYTFAARPFNHITVIPNFIVSNNSCILYGIYLSYEKIDLGYIRSDALIQFYNFEYGVDESNNCITMRNEMIAEILADERRCNMQFPWSKGVTVV